MAISKFDPEKNPRSLSWIRSKADVSIILSINIPFVSNQLYHPSLPYGYFKIWPWKSKVKAMGGVQSQGHKKTQQNLPALRHLLTKMWEKTINLDVSAYTTSKFTIQKKISKNWNLHFWRKKNPDLELSRWSRGHLESRQIYRGCYKNSGQDSTSPFSTHWNKIKST